MKVRLLRRSNEPSWREGRRIERSLIDQRSDFECCDLFNFDVQARFQSSSVNLNEVLTDFKTHVFSALHRKIESSNFFGESWKILGDPSTTGCMQIDRIYILCVVLRLNDQFFISHFRRQLSKVSEETLRQIKTPSFFALCRLSGGYRSVTRVNAAGGDEYICRRAIHSILNVVRIDPTPVSILLPLRRIF